MRYPVVLQRRTWNTLLRLAIAGIKSDGRPGDVETLLAVKNLVNRNMTFALKMRKRFGEDVPQHRILEHMEK